MIIIVQQDFTQYIMRENVSWIEYDRKEHRAKVAFKGDRSIIYKGVKEIKFTSSED